MAQAVKTTVKKPRKSRAELAVQRRRAAIARTRGVLAALAPGRSLVDEVIAERRAEARAEDREDETEARRRRRGRD